MQMSGKGVDSPTLGKLTFLSVLGDIFPGHDKLDKMMPSVYQVNIYGLSKVRHGQQK